MIRNYLKTALRNIRKNKVHSFINIVGLSIGMAVSMVIGLWIRDELSFNKNFRNYNRLAAVMQHQTFNGVTGSQTSLPYQMGDELRKNYGEDFKQVSMCSWTGDHILSYGDKKITQSGNYFEPQITNMLSMKMLIGTSNALQDDHSIILSQSSAKALFGNADPMSKVIRIDNRFDVKVTAVYEDFPYNSTFYNLTFIAPWQLYIDNNSWQEKTVNPWRNNSFQTLVELADNANMEKVSEKIKDVKLRRVTKADAEFKPVVFLHPMRKWHLFNEFKNGVNSGGRIEFVWLFGLIGFFVLILACINFMNLSTAKSEQRAKEVGIRKAIGSLRGQLIRQFFGESVLAVFISFALTLLMVQLFLPFFNDVADKKMYIPWDNPLFWLIDFAFCLITGLISGCYPALYLSSFQPVKVLKGTFRAGRLATLPRKVLVVLQFTISVSLIIATMIVFKQIGFARNRPVGYNRNGLIMTRIVTEEIHNHFNAIENELKNSGAVSEMAETSSGTTFVDEFDNGFEWKGKDPALQGDFGFIYVSRDFGKTIGWQIKEGRDFSKDFGMDSSAFIMNEAAVKFTGLKHPVGEIITMDGKPFHVVGVIKDMVMESPYKPVNRTIFVMDKTTQPFIVLRINPASSTRTALKKIETVFNKTNPAQPFSYKFVDEEYSRKFSDEERIGKLSGFFAALAIFISCLGLFGMASFLAEQRTKEIGVRKVLGASVFNILKLLCTDFVFLIIIALMIASPTVYLVMDRWLQRYEYHTAISLWIFAAAAFGSLVITLATVSYQSVKAALANPVRSLRSE